MFREALRRTARWAQHLDARLGRWRRPEARSVLMDARTPMNLAIIEPVYRAMKHDPRVQFWFLNGGADRGGLRYELDARVRVTTRARAALQRFYAYLAADFLWPPLPRGVPRIHMFHGVAGKYAHIYDRPSHSASGWRQFWFINQRRLSNFLASGAITADSDAARLIGMPKLDALVDGSLRRDDVLASIGIDPARQTVLYVPTWSAYSSLTVMGEELIRELVRAGYAVIVKLHDRSFDPAFVHSGGVDWPARLEPLLRNGGGRLVRGADCTPYLAAADVAITDHSSAGFEYLLLDRPLIRIHVPELIENTNIASEYVELMERAAITAHEPSDVVAAVAAALKTPAHQSAERRAVSMELFHRPGTATARAMGELYDIIDLEPLPAQIS